MAIGSAASSRILIFSRRQKSAHHEGIRDRIVRGAQPDGLCGGVVERGRKPALTAVAGKPVATNSAATFADGMAVRIPHADAFQIIKHGADRIVTVSDDEIAEAMRSYYRCCHTLSEGAGAAPLAALMTERAKMQGKRVGVILSGGNIDMSKFAEVLNGGTPRP